MVIQKYSFAFRSASVGVGGAVGLVEVSVFIAISFAN
jgi:hypothetical protein